VSSVVDRFSIFSGRFPVVRNVKITLPVLFLTPSVIVG
jgi:hypothetical protein